MIGRIDTQVSEVPGRAPRSSWKAARTHEGGATAVEFALVAGPFLALLLVTLETALVYAASGSLQNAVSEVSRLIMTGEGRSLSRAQFQKEICDRMVFAFECAERLAVDVRSLKSLDGLTRASAQSNGSYDTSGWTYDPGSPGSVMVVTAAYRWPTFTGFVAGSSPQAVMAATAFKNEQY